MTSIRNRQRTRGFASVSSGGWGITGWDASTALATASGSGVGGSAISGVSVVVAFQLLAVPSAVNIVGRRLSGNSGWGCRVNSASFQWIAGNGITSVFSPTRTLVAGDVGKLHVAAISCNLTAVFSYFDRVQVGTSTLLAGYAAGAVNHTMGAAENGAQPALDFTILGMAGRDSALTLADYQAICDATKAGGRLELGAISMDHMWRSPVGAMTATLSDAIGSDAMSFIVGTLANVNVVKVPFVWGY